MEHPHERLERLAQQAHTVARRRRWWRGLAGGLLVLAVLTWAPPSRPAREGARAGPDQRVGQPHADGFERFLPQYEAANTAFVNGDPSPWLAITAEQDPASIFGGFGGLGEAGVAAVHERYRLAAGQFSPSGAEVDFAYLVKDVRGRLAYTVAIERATVLYTGHTEPQPQVLRATMIFRFEEGAWKLVHRHADTMVELQLPTP
jgi:SnoaL-like domain